MLILFDKRKSYKQESLKYSCIIYHTILYIIIKSFYQGLFLPLKNSSNHL